MIVLYPNEQILYQKEARLKLSVKLSKEKVEGKGTLYITNMRIVFEDYRQGILTQFTPSEILAYRKVKGLWNEKLCIDFLRNGMKNVMVAEFEFKGVEDAYKLLSMLTNNNAMINYNNNMTKNTNYNMMNITSNNEIDDIPEQYKPWIKDIKFTWNTATRGKELGLISSGNLKPWHFFKAYVYDIETDFKHYVKFDTSKFADDFKFKVARQAYIMRADFPYEKDYTYDSNRYWIGIIENAYKNGKSELVGVNINADGTSGYFIYCPEHWYQCFLDVVWDGYDYERNEPSLVIDGKDISKNERTKRLLLADACKNFYFAVLNKDFNKAEEAWQQISKIYKKYETEDDWLDQTGRVGLVLKYAIEMHKRNIPFPTTIKRSPI
jgi:hypothetical protein